MNLLSPKYTRLSLGFAQRRKDAKGAVNLASARSTSRVVAMHARHIQGERQHRDEQRYHLTLQCRVTAHRARTERQPNRDSCLCVFASLREIFVTLQQKGVS